MRVSLIIVLMVVHLFGNTELGQLLRLPKLVSHYFQHRELNPTVTFMDFLVMHYGGDDGTSADDDSDSQLPYHHVDSHCLFGTFYPLAQYGFSLKPVEDIPVYGSQLISGNPSKHVSLLLQPPRAI
jgi:hypothetical protein